MLRGLLTTASYWLHGVNRALARERTPAASLFVPHPPRTYGRLQRAVLTREVADTLFGDFAEHRAGPRGDEEVGWILLGVREATEVRVCAVLPAGADRDAGVAHVYFNSTAQSVASRILRQTDRRLGMVGVVHTHPGSLRHPSNGDYRGDSQWVGQLRGGEGVFGIGTADGKIGNGQPHLAHLQARGELCFSWYALGENDERYHRLPVAIAEGPDVARALRDVWETIEQHAIPLDALCEQLAKVTFEVVSAEHVLLVRVGVAGGKDVVQLLLHHDEVRLFLDRGGVLSAIDPEEPQIDRAVFLILAELARRSQQSHVAEVRAVGVANVG
jgi:proteasome lid subunit RPN8/RPN11